MAVTLDVATLQAEFPLMTTARATSLLAAASATAIRYSPAAPDELHDEAVRLMVGNVYQSPAPALRREQSGDLSADFAPSLVGAFRWSGAQSLLSPWKIHRAGLIPGREAAS